MMDELCRTGLTGAAAKRLKVEKDTACCYARRAKLKMNVPSGRGGLVLAIIKWDRWRQTDGRGVPA